MEEIHNKWCPVRLIGPNVSPDKALEFIRRTDDSFSYVGCNDRNFCDRFEALIGIDDYEARRRFLEAFDHLALGHLASHWIASAWIHGPSGPVWPTGKVSLAKNFGKWPNIAEVESDLEIIAQNFDWLTFDLALWDTEETTDGDPTHRWSVQQGGWSRVESGAPAPQWPSEPDSDTSLMAVMFKSPSARETTWPVEHIDRMWGAQIRNARHKVLSSSPNPQD